MMTRASTFASKHWCWTIHNPTEDLEQLLGDLGESEQVTYLVWGRENCPETGRPHLQGYIHLVNRKRLNAVKALLGGVAHLEKTKGTPWEAAVYCKKDGNFEEFGTPPEPHGNNGVAGQFESYKRWVADFVESNGRGPWEREIAVEHPALYCRYHRALLQLTTHLIPAPRLQEGELRDWQIDLNNIISGEGTDRVVMFYVDKDGGKGKSFFQRWFATNYSDTCQLLCPGKRDDLAHAIDVSKRVFLFNVPRGGMEFLQYSVLEMLKDRVIFSPKYESKTKIIMEKTHVVVFSNEEPDYSKMSEDRYEVVNL